MAENKTKPTQAPVQVFLEGIEDPGLRADCIKITKIMQELTGAEPKM